MTASGFTETGGAASAATAAREAREARSARWVPVRRAVDVLVVVAALLSVPLTIAELQGHENASTAALDWAVWLVFVADAAVVFTAAPSWRAGLRRAWLALLL